MPTFEYGVTSAAPTIGNQYWDMLAGTSDCFLRELHCFLSAVPTSPIGLFRTTAVGTRTTPVVPTAAQCALSQTGSAPLAGFATAWSVQPTLATNPMRKFQAAASIGAGIIWTWYGPGGGLRIPSGGSIVLNAVGAAGGTLFVTAVWDE
jgi:hypothetical protein